MRPLRTSASADAANPLERARSDLAAGLHKRRSPASLLSAYTRAMDAIVRGLWAECAPGPEAALFATGGYGRRELYPGSDLDLTILLTDSADAAVRARVESLVRRLWDLGPKVGAAVRTLAQTEDAATRDASTFTALCEARRLAGSRRLAAALERLLAAPGIWPESAYLAAKLEERGERHARLGGTAQRLEPSVKESPGGLRDLHTLCWIGARRLDRRQAGLIELERGGLILPRERRRLERAGRILARARLALHLLSGRNEERLLFDLQPRAAELLGYRARPGALAVERFMQDYYRAAATTVHVGNLVFTAMAEHPAPAVPLGADLVARGTAIDFARPEALAQRPDLIFEIFLRWQRNMQLRGLAPSAQRALTAAAPAVTANFRKDPANRGAFLSLLGAPARVAAALATLHEVGLLGRYLPAFARISGRMQYDLFHVYTVDEHVLRVVANAEELVRGRFEPARADLRAAAERIDRPDLLFLAALFHDLAKGRGGDHSVLGAREARRFALGHGLGRAAGDLVAWLVRRHLSLSLTAQKSDLSDPRVITEFARLVGDQRRLDYLYVLTAADVRATNPSLWNSWRAALFGELYQATSGTLWRGLATPLDAASELAARKRETRTLLGGGNPGVARLWQALGDDYFMQYSPAEIAWHTRELLAVSGPPAVFMRPSPDGAGTLIAIYSTRAAFAFGRVTAALAQLGLTIVGARCVPVGGDRTLDTYQVLEHDASPIEDERRLARVKATLVEELARHSGGPPRVTRGAPRQVRLFQTPTRIAIAPDPGERHTVVELTASDRPGLLAAVGRAFRRSAIYLRTAKIMTAGERAEDVFHVTRADGRALEPADVRALEAALYEEIAAEL